MKKTLFLTAAVVCAAFLLVSCTETNTNNANSTNTGNTSKPAERTSSTPAEKPADTTASTGGDIGVAECDEYLKKYEACVTDKVPAAARAQFNSSLELTRKSWKDLAANPQTKPSLAAACKQALESAKTSMGAYGCSW